MLDGLKIQDDLDKRVIALFDVWDGDKSVKLEFFSYKDSYARNLLFNQDAESEAGTQVDKKAKDDDYDYRKFSVLEETKAIEDKISPTEREMLEIKSEIKKARGEKNEGYLSILEDYLPELINKLQELNTKHNKAKFYSDKITEHLKEKKMVYICNYSVNKNEIDKEVLLCKIDNVDVVEAESFLNKLSRKVFLAAPATQVFLFISKESKKLLFRDISNDKNDKNDKNNSYYSEIQTAKVELPGFFAYDFLAIDVLIESFKAARDRDFREAIETGEYGNNYKELMNDLNGMLSNKQIELEVDLSGVNFKLVRDGGSIELSPEDLSHGELKRLGIYMWIKYRNIENAIVLMDEIEIAFHPDWQYQIISDLKQWAPSNQYILATHSYELCQALTPAHVKELEPKLLKQEAQQ
jgi:hypothetical protein